MFKDHTLFFLAWFYMYIIKLNTKMIVIIMILQYFQLSRAKIFNHKLKLKKKNNNKVLFYEYSDFKRHK
jgi:hypothetical protein